MKSIVYTALAVAILTQTASAQDQPKFRELSEPEYQAKVTEYAAKGYLVSDIEVAVRNNAARFDLTLEKPTGRAPLWYAKHHMSDRAFRLKSREYTEKGLELTVHKKYRLNRQSLHAAVWRDKPPTRLEVWTGINTPDITGQDNPDLRPLDNLVQDFIRNNQIPGATLAVSRNGNLVYNRGFGYSDIDKKTKMEPGAMMRIASISKPITATAIMLLVEQQKLNLDDKVLDIIDHRPSNGEKIEDPRFSEITIRHCLNHSAGFDRDASFDPMFKNRQIAKSLRVPSPPKPDHVIRYMLTRELDFEPGAKFAYSNFGYSLLGRVIEKVSGQDYEDFVRANVLKPVGSEKMFCGRSRLRHRKKGEAKYYPAVDRKTAVVFDNFTEVATEPYGAWGLKSMDSHGGWVASASDLVRFADAFNDASLLERTSIEQVFSCPDLGHWRDDRGDPKRVFYGLGWNVRTTKRGINAWHLGKLSGTSTLLVRRHDGFNWAVLFNTDKCADDIAPAIKIDTMIHRTVDAVRQWPD